MKRSYMSPQIAFENMTLNTRESVCNTFYVTDCQEMTVDTITGPETGKEVVFPTGEHYFDSSFKICSDGSFYCYHPSIESNPQLVLSTKS